LIDRDFSTGEGEGEDGDVVFLFEVLRTAGDLVGGVGSWFPTLNAKCAFRMGHPAFLKYVQEEVPSGAKARSFWWRHWLG
jgi:hypothetical protein